MPETDLECSLIFNPCLTPCKLSAHIDKYNQNRSNRDGTFLFFYPRRMRPMFETCVLRRDTAFTVLVFKLFANVTEGADSIRDLWGRIR